jgi:hypothetical protein
MDLTHAAAEEPSSTQRSTRAKSIFGKAPWLVSGWLRENCDMSKPLIKGVVSGAVGEGLSIMSGRSV